MNIVWCQSCRRSQIAACTSANAVSTGLGERQVSLRVTVMRCAVDGRGEARAADLMVAARIGKGQNTVEGEVIETVPESLLVRTSVDEARPLGSSRGTTRQRPAGRARAFDET